ncbi:hypothetical protein IB241_18515 [Pseudomonas sp. PDM05]|jgi:hypothetical protein|uniref:hypothetical protein n=1 Tax=Pseudomonas sp. PDM05 TaxID=2769301 RepID=UPI00177E54DC|nr:hypothetical protein [Pseudomonas sp. PDM05]MBD9459682.1 hypothetical protein [Pseudomonas sp. PDM05]
MKLSTLMLAGLMTLTSAAAFAEGGAERSKEFYANFKFMQEQSNGKAEQTAANDAKQPKPEQAAQRGDEQQPKI